MDTVQKVQAIHAANRIIKANNLQIHPIERGLFDVFSGNGWENHGRYRNYRGVWYHVSGMAVDKASLPVIGK